MNDITNTDQLLALLFEWLEKPNLELCLVGQCSEFEKPIKYCNHTKPTGRNQWYYEFTVLTGPFNEHKIHYQRTYFRKLTEREMINDIIHAVTKQGTPWHFNKKKGKFIKDMEVYG